MRVVEADRVYCGGVYGMLPPPPSEFTGTPTPPSSGAEQGGRLPRKKRTSVSWPRRGRRGLRLHRGASSHGGSRSGGTGFPVPYERLPSPGFEAPARFVGK